MRNVGVLLYKIDHRYIQDMVGILQASGAYVQVFDIPAADLPFFDARPTGEYYSDGVARLRQLVGQTQVLVLATSATIGGCPGGVLNMLQLLGGATYDEPQANLPLLNRPVALLATGPSEQAHMAIAQMQSLIEAMGGAVIVVSLMDDLHALSPQSVVHQLMNGPFANGIHPIPMREPIDLGLGHVHLLPSPRVQKAAISASEEISTYAPSGGIPSLRRALAAYLRERGLSHATSSEILVTGGASLGLYACLAAHLQPGDGLLLPDPGFPNFRQLAEALHVRSIPYTLHAELGYLPDPHELSHLIPHAKAIIWNFPHNPLGSVAPSALIETLVDITQKHNVLIVSDEVYAELVWDGAHLSPATIAPKRTCVVGSFSKISAMAGYRVGWLLAPPSIADRVVKLHWTMAMSVPSLSQHAALAALQDLPSYLPKLRDWLGSTRAAALSLLSQAGLPCHAPESAYYLWVNIRKSNLNSIEFANRLAREVQVEVVPGTVFGAMGDGYIRISIAAPQEQVLTGLERLIDWYRTLGMSQLQHNKPAQQEKKYATISELEF